MQWNEIEHRYHEYHAQYPSVSMINIIDVDGSGVEYPLKWGIINRESAVIDSIERPTDQNLLSFDDSAPDIRELTHEQLLKLSIPLTRIGQAKVTEDHRSYWRASYEYVRPLEPNESQNFDEMVRIVTKLSCIFSEPESESFLRSKTYLLANYMAYAVLEALLKGFCQDDVRHDGCLKPDGRIRKLSQNEDYYEYSRNTDTFVSNIGALLLHVEEEVARDGFADLMENFRREVSAFSENAGPNQAYGLIKDWRNSLYHGQAKPVGQILIIMNLICLLRWEHGLYAVHYFEDLFRD